MKPWPRESFLSLPTIILDKSLHEWASVSFSVVIITITTVTLSICQELASSMKLRLFQSLQLAISCHFYQLDKKLWEPRFRKA